MATEYVLPFTGIEVEEKLKEIEKLSNGFSWNALEDKPFGEGVEEEVLIAENAYAQGATIPYQNWREQSIQAGVLYAVYFDGERYESIAVSDDYGYGMIETPSVIIKDDGGGTGYMICGDSDLHTISVFIINKVTVPLPEEYIPDTIARTDENGKLLNSVLPDGYPMKASVTETLLENEIVPSDGLNTSGSIGLEVGKAYTVIWDGVDYPDLIAYQNDFLISLPSGLPFEVGDCPEDGFCDIIPSDGAEHTVTIMGQSSTVIPMSKEYLPKAIAIADLTEAPTAADFNNLLAALRAAGYMAE